MKHALTLCALLSTGCLYQKPAKEADTKIVDICPATARESSAATEFINIYNIVLPNNYIIWSDNVNIEKARVNFCSRDPYAIEKSYLQGRIQNHSYPFTDEPIYVNLEIDDYQYYSFKLSLIGRNIPDWIKDSNTISIPTIKAVEGNCPKKGRMYSILQHGDVLDVKQIKTLKIK